MLTGQYPRTHGAWNNGIALRHDSPTVAQYLKENSSFRTALIGKPHFEPFSSKHSMENSLGISNLYGPVRGFDTMIVASPDLIPQTGHYTQWLKRHYPKYLDEYYDLLNIPDEPGEHSTMNVIGGGDTDAPFVKSNHIPTELYHTDWVADHTIRWIDSMDPEDDWYCWMSFPDPHHLYDPPASETHRINWRDIDVDELYGESNQQREAWLDTRPKHWKWWWTGEKFVSFEALEGYSYLDLLDHPDKVREINAMIHISNALIDDAIGRVMAHLEAKGWLDDTDIIFTPDHGGLDGDTGMLFIGPALSQKGRIADMSDLIYSDLLNRPLLHPVPEPGALI